ncbi:MAG: RNA polymerase sigma factor [Gammaproteobacteria bacterium]|nr:RNA polymerase sigma factor [Gammaproteobacteria bacterium]
MNGQALSLMENGASAAAEREKLNLDQRQAMDRFLAGVEKRAFRIAQIAVGDGDDALDIVQDAMISLARKYGERPTDEWAPLFYRILQNRIRDHQRRQTVRRKVFGWLDNRRDDDDMPDPVARAADGLQAQPEHRVAIDGAMSELEAAIQALPARQQQAFLLRTVEGLDVAATAAAMGCSSGSVKTHYSRAVHRLRESLGEHWT